MREAGQAYIDESTAASVSSSEAGASMMRNANRVGDNGLTVRRREIGRSSFRAGLWQQIS